LLKINEFLKKYKKFFKNDIIKILKAYTKLTSELIKFKHYKNTNNISTSLLKTYDKILKKNEKLSINKKYLIVGFSFKKQLKSFVLLKNNVI
jgi:hypothetical protein